MDVDLSDIGCFSLSPQDLIQSGLAVESQVNGSKFKTSMNLNELPQIVTSNRIIDVSPLWGEPDICSLGITRCDFDLTQSNNINIQPTAVFMGSIVSTANEDSIKRNCKPKNNTGNMCDLISGPGQILAIRQTIFSDDNGDPILEQFSLEQDGKIIDDNGAWLTNLPMNLDYVITNEFGEQILSSNPNKGIPTKGKYRFKVKWQNEQGLQNDFLRANYLIPNIKEYGWSNSSQTNDPFNPNQTQQILITLPVGGLSGTTTITSSGGLLFENTVNTQNITIYINNILYTGDINVIPVSNGDQILIVSTPIDDTQQQTITYKLLQQGYFDVLRSYAFSLDWDDYVNKQSAINCDDTFYEFNYNKVYTVSSFIDRYKNGRGRSRHLGIKEITDRSCQSENNKFPVNDLQRNFDFIEFVVSILLFILKFPLIILISVAHFVAAIWPIFKWLIIILIPVLLIYLAIQSFGTAATSFPALGIAIPQIAAGVLYTLLLVFFIAKIIPRIIAKKGFSRIALPMISYPDCDACACEDRSADFDEVESFTTEGETNSSLLANTNTSISYGCGESNIINKNPNIDKFYKQCDDLDDNQQVLAIQNATTQYYQMFAGVDDVDLTWRRGSTSFLSRGGDCGIGNNEYGYPLTEPWSQKLNSFNLRDKYFSNVNQITTSVNGSPEFKDQVVVIIGDPGMISTFQSGDLLTFNDPQKSTDLIRLTGLTDNSGNTITNEFGTSSITGTTTVGQTIGKTIYYANPNDPNNNIPVNINITQTGDIETNYKFITDTEYFQVITGLTVQQFIDLGPDFNDSGSFPSEYLYHRIRYTYDKWGVGGNNKSQSWSAIGTQCGGPNLLSIMILVRGVDPYTDRQNITYGIGRLFGKQHNAVQVNGMFKLNYPIRGYSNGLKPIEHNNFIDNTPITSDTDRKLFYPSFTFTPDTTLFTQYPNQNSKLLYYYLSTDNNNSNLGPYSPVSSLQNISLLVNTTTNRLLPLTNTNRFLPLNNGLSNPNGFVDTQLTSDDNTGTQYNTTVGSGFITAINNYYIGGGTFLYSDVTRSSNFGSGSQQQRWWLYSPAYHTYTSLIGVNFNNVNGIVMRSDRLPTSTTTEGSTGNVNTSFALHQNNSFSMYKIPDTGLLDTDISVLSVSPDESGTMADLDYTGSVGTTIVNSLSCGGLVELKCYTGSGINFGIDQNCLNNDRVENGCYYLLNKPYISQLDDDIKLFLEWSTRFRINFAACRGVFSHMFQNNWINGVLYMPSFNKGSNYGNNNQLLNYDYCERVVIFDETTNNFYYRSSPWNNISFVGAPPPPPTSAVPGLLPAKPDPSQNKRQIQFPTTIMDLGNRDQFIVEICSNPNLSGEYLANTLRSTSYNDTSDLLQLGVISRLINSTWLQQLIGVGDASVNQFFSRDGDRIDGDFAQSFSINSEYEVNPFISGNYPDDFLFLGEDTPGKPVFGIFYNTNQQQYQNRKALSPGLSIFSTTPLIQNYYGYPSTQEVPNYKWKLDSNTTIFGNETNNWFTDAPFFSKKYQELNSSSGDYFTTTTSLIPNINFGFITNFDQPYSFSGVNVPKINGGPSQPFVVGVPNHFYFGLKNGKTSLNKFIKTYIDTSEI
jgi:hypothetical protein